MDINQNTIKKIVANGICKSSINTSLVMFPIRIETRLLKKEVATIDAPERIYFVYKSIWDFLETFDSHENDEKLCLVATERVMDKVMDLDVVYKADYELVLSIINAICQSSPIREKSNKINQKWDEILDVYKRIKPVTNIESNPATRFVKRVEKASKRAKVFFEGEMPYKGMFRHEPPCSPHGGRFGLGPYIYSDTAWMKCYIKHLGECIDVMKELDFQQGEIIGLKNSNYLHGGQKDRLRSAMYFPWPGEEFSSLEDTPRTKSLVDKVKRITECYKQEVSRLINRRNQLLEVIAHFPSIGYRYTHLLAKLCNYRLYMMGCLQSSRMKHNDFRRWEKIARYTYSPYVEVNRLLLKAISYFESHVFYNDVNLKGGFMDASQHSQHRTIHFKEVKNCLCIRIYPDVLAVSAALRPFTRVELEEGLEFWNKWIAECQVDERKNLWESFCRIYAPNRAAWIVKNIKRFLDISRGMNIDFNRLIDAFGVTDSEGIDFQTAFTELMPDRFTVQATMKTRGEREQTLIKYGHRIPKRLQVGFDFNREIPLTHIVGDKNKNNDRLVLNGNLRWMTDYDEAERVGMAVTIPLDQFAYSKIDKSSNVVPSRIKNKTRDIYEFPSIYVSGVRSSSTNQESSELIRRTLERHLFGENGLDVIDFHTPTNILHEKDEVPLDTRHRNLVDAYFDLIQKEETKNWEKTDAYNLSKLFGIDPDAPNNPLRYIPHVEQSNIYEARKKNRAFLKAHSKGGSGEYFEFINRLNNSTYKRYFAHNVLPCGVYAPLRVGDQPYGVLPITDFKNMSIAYKHYMHLIKDILIYVSTIWNQLVKKYVIYDGNKVNDVNNSKNILKVLGNSPLTNVYYQRKTVKAPDFLNPYYFRGFQSWNKALTEIFQIVSRHSEGESVLNTYDFLSYINGFEIPVKDVLQRTERPDDAEILDLFLHRLDAWFIGMLNRHIQRHSNGYSIKIGAFGWVFDAVFITNQEQPTKNEYVLAPSVNHAITAAVLRSSFKRNNCTDGQADYNLSVNLSSNRVRKALRIIKGIRNGLSLGAILGSDLERLIHEDYVNGYEMDEFIYWLRQHYPLSPDIHSNGQGLYENPTINVINGVALLEKLRSCGVDSKRDGKLELLELYRKYPNEIRRLIAPEFKMHDSSVSSQEDNEVRESYMLKIDRLMQLIANMEDGYDALADVIMSESVYKLTEGNRAAVDSLMNCLDNERNIPLPDVTEIPLNSAHIEQRVLLSFDGSQPEEEFGLLGTIEPSVERWLRETLHYEDMSFCFSSKNENQISRPATVNLSATELVYLSENKEEFFLFMSYLVWQHKQFEADRPIFMPDQEEICFAESELAINSLRELLTTARPMKAEDFAMSSEENQFDTEHVTYDLTDLAKRFDRVCQLWQDKLLQPIDTLSYESNFNREYMSHALNIAITAFRLGFKDSLLSMHKVMNRYKDGINGDGFDVEEQAKQFKSILNSLCQSVRDAYSTARQELAENKSSDAYIKAIRRLANHICLVPVLSYESTNEDCQQLSVITRCIHNQSCSDFTFKNVTDSTTIDDWITDVAKVRKPMQYFHNILMYRKWNLWESTIRPAQTKKTLQDYGDEWIGLEVENEKNIVDTKSYLILNPEAFHFEQNMPLKGLVLDFWVERIPYKEQTAAVAFHFDQPDAEAPQSILVGLCTSKIRGRWSENQLNRIIRAAMHMIKGRAVEPEHLYADESTSGMLPLVGYSGKQDN